MNPAAIEMVVDFHGVITQGADDWRRYTGAPDSPCRWSDLLPATVAEHRATLFRIWSDALTTQTSFACHAAIFSRAARRYRPCVMRGVRSSERSLWTISIRESLEPVDDMPPQVTALDEARLEEIVQNLVRGLAHRFNNGLHAALGHAGLIEAASAQPAVRESARRIATASRQMADTFAALLACSSTLPTELASLDLGASLLAWQGELRELAHNDVAVELIPSTERYIVSANPRMLREALVQLLHNAVEASLASSGAVRLCCGVMQLSEPQRLVARPACNAHPAKHYAFIEVRDDGAGISAQHLRHVFDPFYSTRFLGRGLGLPTALASMRRMGGLVLLDSGPGAGTVARLLFPQPEADEAHEPATPSLRLMNGGAAHPRLRGSQRVSSRARARNRGAS